MELEIIINDEVCKVNINKEEVKKLIKSKTGLEIPEIGETYYAIGGDGKIYKYNYDDCTYGKNSFESGSGFSDKRLADDHARARRLERKLLKYASINNKQRLERKREKSKYYIYYDVFEEKIIIGNSIFYRDIGQIYFETKLVAEQALEENKEELMWYFREFQPYIRAYE